MATSGSFSGSIRNGGYTLRVDWNASQNITNNTSTISATMYLVLKSGYSLSVSGRDDNTITIDGSEIVWESPRVRGTGTTTTLATVTSQAVQHNTDGTKSITITAAFNIRATISGTYYERITATATIDLDTIPRATQPNVNVSSAEMGSTVTIGLPRASTAFTHDLYYKFGSADWVWIEGGVGAYKYWAVPHLEASIPNATSGVLTIRAVTKNGTTTIGTKDVSMTAVVPATCIPTITSISITEATAGVSEQFGAFVQNKSTLSVSIEAEGVEGSTIAEYYSYFGGAVFNDSTYTTPTLTASNELRIKVKDSRGRWSDVSANQIDVVEYNVPKIEVFSALRCDSNGNANEEGECLTIQLKYAVSSIGAKNTASVSIEAKQDTESESGFEEIATMTDLSADTTILITDPTFSTDYTFDLRMVLTDWFGGEGAKETAIVPSGFAIIDIRADGRAIGFGKVAEHDGADLGFPIRMTGGEIQPILEEGTDLDDVVLCGRYTGQDVSSMGYLNAPIAAGSFTLDVSGNGQGDGLFLKHVLSHVRKVDSVEYTRFYFSGAWGNWVVTGMMGSVLLGTATLE